MAESVIKVEGLSKRYRIGALKGEQRSVGRALGDLALVPWRRLRSFGQSSHRVKDSIWALKDVSFEVQRGEVLGLVGANGAGKTTLLKILSRITEPTEGRAEIRGRIGSLLEVGTGFHQELTGRENIYLSGAILGMSRARIGEKFDEIVEFSGVEKFLDTPIKRYSSGMKVRLGFAVAAHLDPEVLLIDEILAVGDLAFRRKCVGKMDEVASAGRTVVFVSHQMGAVSDLCHKALWIDEGRCRAYGDTRDVIAQYQTSALVSSTPSAPGVLYEAPPDEENECCITRVQMLDGSGRPLVLVRTGQSVVFRLHYRCPEAISDVAFAVEVLTPLGSGILKLTSVHVSGRRWDLPAGKGYADCAVDWFPLAAGLYLFRAGMLLPRRRWSAGMTDMVELTVGLADVDDFKHAPRAPATLVAAPHCWSREHSAR